MRWEDERYIRLYTRDTTDWLALSFDAQALFALLLRKVDRAGLLVLGKHGKRGVAIAIGHPREWERLGPALEELLADGCCAVSEDGLTLVVPNFIAAQESTASAVQRTREYRERERDRVRAGLPSAAQKAAVIYFIQSEHGGPIKVGRADDLAKRVMGLQTGRPDKLVVLAAAEGTRQDERDIHAAFAAHRERGEWFHPAPVLLAFIRDVTDNPSRINAVTEHVSSYAASPETSLELSPVTPSLAVPCRAEPSHAGSSASQAPAVAAPGGQEDDMPDATDHAEELPERPPLELVSQSPGRKPRQPSRAEALYAALQDSRRERCEQVGAEFVDDGWKPARMNRDLGALARLAEDSPEAKRLNAAWAEYLADESRAGMDVPWSLGYFLASRSTWEGRAIKAAGGAS